MAGRPIVQWVYEAAVASEVFQRVVVATDDERIARSVNAFGGESLLTDTGLATGSERVAAAAALLPDQFDVIANIQGDQPFVRGSDLVALLSPFADGFRPEMTTLAAPLARQQVDDLNTVKVVTDVRGRALYFSRAAIPAVQTNAQAPATMRQHLGLYAFRSDFLSVYAGLPPTPLEMSEQLEQLRAIEHGYTILVRDVAEAGIEINTGADYERALTHVSQEGGI
jgi:3-deoxy-manno-octulosonate cytidylyltransferase (CMP-KDO synthetase)